MQKLLKYLGVTLLGLVLLFGGWWVMADEQVHTDRPQLPMEQYADLEREFQQLFQLANDGDTINLPAGYFKFSKALIIDGKHNLTIKGAGMDKTVLSFREQQEGAEGIRVANGSNIVLEDFTIQDAIGDNIKAIYIDSLVFRRVRTEWTAVPNTSLGAYGIYPVICSNVLIEACEALRASDSGLYVGQSDNVVIRNNKAMENVCGINIENSAQVVVYDNDAFHNTCGITVLDIPGLTRYMDGVEIYNNRITNNNLFNFAPAGNVAASTLPGTGITIWAGKHIDIHDNAILGNAFPITMVSFLSSYKLTKDKPYVPIAASEQARMEVGIAEEASLREDEINARFKEDQMYNPYCVDIQVRNNTWSFGPLRKKLQSKDGLLFTLALANKDAHIWYDGVENPGGSTLCVGEVPNVLVANLDIANDSKNVHIVSDMASCPLTSIDQ